MTMLGHFENGVVVLDSGTPLPDGTIVTLYQNVFDETHFEDGGGIQPLPFPFFLNGVPGSLKLTAEDVDEILSND